MSGRSKQAWAWRLRLATAALVVACFAAVPPADAHAARGDTILISRQSDADGGLGARGDSRAALNQSISSNGRYVAFTSRANNLSDDDDTDVGDVFVRDQATGETVLVSRRSASLGGAGGDSRSGEPSISDDGRYVAFESAADNLSGSDTATVDVFVRDLVDRETTLVSRTDGSGGTGGDFDSGTPSIADDGSHVAFVSDARNLSTRDEDDTGDIFVRDLLAEKTLLVSRADGSGGEGADGDSFLPSISEDGSAVAFTSLATNLSGIDREDRRDVFLRDLSAAKTGLVSRQSTADGGAAADGDSYDPSISDDGRHVAFSSTASNLSDAEDPCCQAVYVRGNGTTSLVSRQSQARGGAGANGSSFEPSISANGRYVAFASMATNLSGRDGDAYTDVFARDTVDRTTTLVSRRSPTDGGAAANGNSGDPSISDLGRFVAFDSKATNLSNLDRDAYWDVFRHDYLGP